MKRLLLAAILLSPLPAIAEPDEAEKLAALREAYRIAGPGVSWGMVDMSMTTIVPQTLPEPVAGVVRTVPVKVDKPVKVAEVASVERNVCTKHGKKKVMRNNGKSWNCR